jgi:hypothetical protein
MADLKKNRPYEFFPIFVISVKISLYGIHCKILTANPEAGCGRN